MLADRVLVGSGFPLQPFGRTQTEWNALPLPEEIRRKWLGENAARLLRLPRRDKDVS